MDELQLYGKDGLFHNIVRQSKIMNGRYAVLPKGGADLNLNNIISGLELPQAKYPGVFCLPPMSELPGTTQGGFWECFYIRLFFLCTSKSTGDNKIKSLDPTTNTSLHTVPMDWKDMKIIALGFMNALEKIQRLLVGQFRMQQGSKWKIIRLSNVQNDNLSGVMLQFECAINTPCEFTDINIDGNNFELPSHFH
jgi:hypothetical protein